MDKPIRLEYFNGEEWVLVSEWRSEHLAWVSIGNDDVNYRTVDAATGVVLTDILTIPPTLNPPFYSFTPLGYTRYVD